MKKWEYATVPLMIHTTRQSSITGVKMAGSSSPFPPVPPHLPVQPRIEHGRSDSGNPIAYFKREKG